MTDTNPTATEPTLTIPPDISALLDEATLPDGRHAAFPMADRIQLIDTASRQVVREVLWPQAGEWARNVLNNVDAAMRAQEEASAATTIPENCDEAEQGAL